MKLIILLCLITSSCLAIPRKVILTKQFVVLESQETANPVTANALRLALKEWSDKLGVVCTVKVQKTGNFPWANLDDKMFWADPSLVRVRISKLPDQYGNWSPPVKTLSLNPELLEKDPDNAYRTALHEIGHIWGLPHFINFKDLLIGPNIILYSEDIVVPPEIDAQELIMYPTETPKQHNKGLTDIEVAFAKHFIR